MSDCPTYFRSGNEDLPHFADVAHLAVWRDGDIWRIGPRGDTTSPLFHRVLELAARPDEGASIAWSLLLRAEFGAEGIAALLDEVRRHEEIGDGWLELEPLFARLAPSYPLEVASVFPRAVWSEMLALCGEHGVVAAFRAIVDEDKGVREPGSLAILEMVERGLDLTPDQERAVRRAAAREPIVDPIRENLDDALRALEARRAKQS